MSGDSAKERIGFIDIARFYAIALVFYGHFIEELMLLKNPAAAIHYKFIYSFHMVLFIVLAGYVAKERDIAWSVGLIMTVASLAICIPLIFMLNRFVPQLVGKPKLKGPLLKNLI